MWGLRGFLASGRSRPPLETTALAGEGGGEGERAQPASPLRGAAPPTPPSPSRTSVRCAPLRPTHPPSDFLPVGAAPPRPHPERRAAPPPDRALNSCADLPVNRRAPGPEGARAPLSVIPAKAGIHPGHRRGVRRPPADKPPRPHPRPFPSFRRKPESIRGIGGGPAPAGRQTPEGARAPLSVIPAKAGIHPGHRRGSGARRPTNPRGRTRAPRRIGAKRLRATARSPPGTALARQRSLKTPSGSSRGGVGGSPPLRQQHNPPPGNAASRPRVDRRGGVWGGAPPCENWTAAPSFATTGMARIVAGTPPALTRRCSSALLPMCRASPLGRRCASPPVARASPARRRRQAGTGGEASFQRAAPRGFPPHKGRPRAAFVAFSSSGGTSTATRPFAAGSPSQGGQSE